MLQTNDTWEKPEMTFMQLTNVCFLGWKASRSPGKEHLSGVGRLSSSELWLREASFKKASFRLSAFPCLHKQSSQGN